MHLLFPLVLAALLFALGVYGVLARRHLILVLMGLELMLAAVGLLFVAFDMRWHDQLHAGQSFTLFIIAIAAAEIGVGLAIVLHLFRLRSTTDIEEIGDIPE